MNWSAQNNCAGTISHCAQVEKIVVGESSECWLGDFGGIASGEATSGAVGYLEFPVREIEGRCGDSEGFNFSIQLICCSKLNSVGDLGKTDGFEKGIHKISFFIISVLLILLKLLVFKS